MPSSLLQSPKILPQYRIHSRKKARRHRAAALLLDCTTNFTKRRAVTLQSRGHKQMTNIQGSPRQNPKFMILARAALDTVI
jgi:hypothetical protein